MKRTTTIVGDAQISDEEYLRFRDYFYRNTGIYFEDQKRYFVDKRIAERMAITKNDSFGSYFSYLKFHPENRELQELINVMTVNETYFFREDYQFKCLVNSVLAEVVENKKDDSPIKIWVIPSSTGEEAYTVALFLLEYWRGIDDHDVQIFASDIDTEALKSCANGVYSARSIQYVPDDLRRKHFVKQKSGDWQISEELRQSVDFCKVNLSDMNSTKRFRRFDVVFCRNLLIYFDDASRRIAVDNIYDSMSPGGFVFLGHSESMSRISSLFKVRKYSDAICYQKPDRGRQP